MTSGADAVNRPAPAARTACAKVGRAAAAAGAALLGAACLRSLHAEAAYEAGLALSVDPHQGPAHDLPGRLAWYEEAMERDPGDGLYALRAGQIRLARATPRGARPDLDELAAARGLLARAAALRPLDFRPRAELARAATTAGDAAGAVREADAALLLGRRAPGAARAAVDVGLRAWRATGDVAGLRTALRGGVSLAAIGEPATAAAPFARAFADADAGLAHDLSEAVKGDPDLAAFAADAARVVRPDVAKQLAPDGPR